MMRSGSGAHCFEAVNMDVVGLGFQRGGRTLRSGCLVEHVAGDLPAARAASKDEQLTILLGAGRSSGRSGRGALGMRARIRDVALHRQLIDREMDVDPDVREESVIRTP